MLKRYSEVQPVITALCSDDEVLNELAMTLSERNIILGGGSVPAESSILNKVNAFDEATRLIQKRDFNIAYARQAFDFLLARNRDNHALLHHLYANDPIVHDAASTNGLIKITNGEEDKMTLLERQKCEILLRQRLSALADKPTSAYIKVGWIPCTTCEVERLFSTCKDIFSEFRKGLLPETMETILYLRVNRKH